MGGGAPSLRGRRTSRQSCICATVQIRGGLHIGAEAIPAPSSFVVVEELAVGGVVEQRLGLLRGGFGSAGPHRRCHGPRHNPPQRRLARRRWSIGLAARRRPSPRPGSAARIAVVTSAVRPRIGRCAPCPPSASAARIRRARATPSMPGMWQSVTSMVECRRRQKPTRACVAVLDDLGRDAEASELTLDEPAIRLLIFGHQDANSTHDAGVEIRCVAAGIFAWRCLNERNGEREGAAASCLARHRDIAALQPRQPARNGQTEAGAAEVLRRRGIRLRERLEQSLPGFGRHADAAVADREGEHRRIRCRRRARDRQRDGAGRGEFDRIAEQVAEDLVQPQGIDGDIQSGTSSAS
jgi:hypothetical protein